jgi:hypothetical protein
LDSLLALIIDSPFIVALEAAAAATIAAAVAAMQHSKILGC